jgi:hypothetical protein
MQHRLSFPGRIMTQPNPPSSPSSKGGDPVAKADRDFTKVLPGRYTSWRRMGRLTKYCM